MSIMKKAISLLLCVVMLTSVLASCNTDNLHDHDNSESTTDQSHDHTHTDSSSKETMEEIESDDTHTETLPEETTDEIESDDTYTETLPEETTDETESDDTYTETLPEETTEEIEFDDTYTETLPEETTDETESDHTHTPATAITENYVGATCTKTGSYDEVVYCSVCEDEISRTPKTIDIKPHEHTQKVITAEYLKTEATCTNSAVYYYSCSCGDKGTDTFTSGDTLEHTFDQKVATSIYLKDEATCTSNAVYYYSCTCGEKGTDTFTSGDVLEHTFDQKVETNTYLKDEATCTDSAVYYYSCVCGEKGSTTFTSDTTISHTYALKNIAEIYQKSAATCTSRAVYYYSCICGEKGTETFNYGSVAPHTFDQKNTASIYQKSAATCTSSAEYYYSCVCGEKGTETFNYGNPNEHSHTVKNTDSKYLATEADCERPATYFYSCACGNKGTTTFNYGSVTGHSYTIQNVDPKYEKTPASEYTPAIFWKSCACGKASTTETFTHGNMLPGYLTYRLSQDSSYYIVTGFVGADENITIPHIYDSLPVFGIMQNAFKDNTTLKSITMSNSIQEIGSYAFAGCTSLESIVIPTSVKIVSPYTFSGCTLLKTVTIPSNIEEIGEFAFENCTALKSITLNEGLLTISNNAFVNCSSLEGITIPDTVTTLGNMAFKNATSLKYVNFSKALESIGNATFNNCVSLESVELHENISSLGRSAFSGCTGLKTLRILGNLINIGSSIFYDCRNLTSIYYASITKGSVSNENYIFYNAGVEGNGITLTVAKDAVIPDGLFTPYVEDNMPKITKIIIEDGATKVSFSMTYNKLPYLTEIVYPNTVTEPCYGAFNNSPWWDNQQFGKVFISSVFYGYKCHCQLAAPNAAVQENRVKATCTVDGHYDSVIYCSVCHKELSREVKIIEKFGGGHTSVDLFYTVNNDDNYPFDISNVYYGNDEIYQTTITSTNKDHNSSANFTITAQRAFVLELYYATSSEEGYDFLKIYHNSTQKVKVSGLMIDGMFTFGEGIDILMNPGDTVTITYSKDSSGFQGLDFAKVNIYTIQSQVVEENRVEPTCTGDGHYDKIIFCGKCNEKLSRETVTLEKLGHSPTSEVEENRVEATCTENGHYDRVIYCGRCNEELLRETIITVPVLHNLKNGFCIECGCELDFSSGLKFISNGDNTCSVSGIGDCTDTNIYIPKVSPDGDLVTKINHYAFEDCSNLTSIVIPDSVTSIKDGAFENCKRLVTIIIPDSVTSIGSRVFVGCDSLAYNEYDNVCYLGNGTNPYAYLIKAKTQDITSVKIHWNTKCIYQAAFYMCSKLISITIPDSVTNICSTAFGRCDSLVYNEYDNVCYLGSDTNPYAYLIKAKTQDITSVKIHENTKYICESAFSSCSITSVTIPNGVTSIGNIAFANCDNLTKVTIQNGTTFIGDEVFWYCTNLQSLTIGDNVASIGEDVFQACFKLDNIQFKGTKDQWRNINKETLWHHSTASITVYCKDGTVTQTKR